MTRTRLLALAAVAALALPLSAARAQSAIPDAATARCTDKSFSMSASKAGACSGHGGVAAWFGAKPAKAIARCKDGEYWEKSRQGACSGHGGVLAFLDTKADKKAARKK